LSTFGPTAIKPSLLVTQYMQYSCMYFTVSLTAKIEMFTHKKIKYDLCEFLAYQLVNEIAHACGILSTFGPTAI
jgi:hypothetical protein